MPTGVVGQQLPRGMRPGRKLLDFTPAKLVELNAAKGTTALYEELKRAVVDECGGMNITGWQSKLINAVVARFQPRFNEHGMGLHYSMVKWWVQHGQSGHMEYRYWFEFSDVAVIGAAYVPADVFPAAAKQPAKDTAASTVVGVTVSDEHDITGAWQIDPTTATGVYRYAQAADGTAVRTVTRNGPVLNFSGLDPSRSWFGRCLHQTREWAAPAQRAEANVYKVRIAGETVTLTAASADTMTAVGLGGTCTLRRKSAPFRPASPNKPGTPAGLEALVIQHGRAAISNPRKPVYLPEPALGYSQS